MPLQSSSMPLQVASLAAAPARGSQVSLPQVPALQVSIPVFPEQAPIPQVVGRVNPSSTDPSQLSSMLLQVSAVGLPEVQVSFPHVPAVQVSVPVDAHAPTPH